MRFKNYLWGLLVALASLNLTPVAHASPQVQWKDLAPDLRATQYEIPFLMAQTATITRAAGTNGTILNAAMYSGSVAYSHITVTSTLGPIQYPARLTVAAVDLGSATTPILQCSSVVIIGNGPTGLSQTETLAVTETAQLTTYAYESLSSVVATGCTSAGDTSDLLTIYPTTWVYPGTPLRIDSQTTRYAASSAAYYGSQNIISVCSRRQTATTNAAQAFCAPGYLFEAHGPSNTINLATTFQGTVWQSNVHGADRTLVVIRSRAPRW